MKINKSDIDIDFNAIDDAVDALNDTNFLTALTLCATIIQTVANESNNSVDDQLENVKRLVDAFNL